MQLQQYASLLQKYFRLNVILFISTAQFSHQIKVDYAKSKKTVIYSCTYVSHMPDSKVDHNRKDNTKKTHQVELFWWLSDLEIKSRTGHKN